MRLELRERLGDRPAKTVATASLLADGTVEIVGEPASVDFLSLFRVLDPTTDMWVSKEENAELWFDLIPAHIKTPFRWVERRG